MTTIDLTHTLNGATPVYPGDAPLQLSQTATFGTHGYNNSELKTGMHVGTHLDGPLHMSATGTTIDKWPLDKLTGEAVVFDVAGQGEILLTEEVKKADVRDKIVLFRSGHSDFYHQDAYFTTHPVLSEALADYLVSQGIKIVGIDFPSPDKAPYTIHFKFLSNNVLIAENLTNLDRLIGYEYVKVIVVPLKIEADSAPARVIAFVK